MSQITQLFKDKLKTIKQYPITLIKAIYDDKGNRLDNILGNTDISSIGDGTITGGIKSVSDEVNKNASDITELNSNLLPFIVGTQTVATGVWTGIASSVSSLYDGLTIRYWLPYDGSGNATLNLTLSDGSTTGAIACYYNGKTRLTTHYKAGNVITLTYRSGVSIAGSSTKYTGWWAGANYDSGNTKNTAGSTDTSSKIFLIGATSQNTSSVTYSHDTAYIDTDGCLYSNSTKVSVDGHTHNYSYSNVSLPSVGNNSFENIKELRNATTAPFDRGSIVSIQKSGQYAGHDTFFIGSTDKDYFNALCVSYYDNPYFVKYRNGNWDSREFVVTNNITSTPYETKALTTNYGTVDYFKYIITGSVINGAIEFTMSKAIPDNTIFISGLPYANLITYSGIVSILGLSEGISYLGYINGNSICMSVTPIKTVQKIVVSFSYIAKLTT